jgi:putative transposase
MDFHLKVKTAYESVIAEFLPKSKLQTLITKLNSSKQNSLTITLSKILEAVLTGKEKVLLPFWTKFTKEKSKKLWLPTKTGYPDLALNSYSTSLNNIKSNSWFSIKQKRILCKNSLMTSSQLLQSSQLDIMAPESTLIRTRKLKLFLNKDQKTIFRQWIGTSRFLYNKVIEVVNDPVVKYPGKSKIRTQLVTNVAEEVKWQKNVPQAIREGGVFDAHTAYDVNMAKYKKSGKTFTLKYRSKKAMSQSIVIGVDALKKGLNLYPKLLGKNSCLLVHGSDGANIKYRTKVVNVYKDKLDENGDKILDKNGEPIKEKIGTKNAGERLMHSLRLQMTRTGKWYLCVPIEKETVSSDNQGAIISLDPGVRTFLTGYSPDGYVCQIGEGDFGRVHNYLLKTDAFRSLISKTKGKKKWKYYRAWLKRLLKVKNWIKDCHRKVVKFLVHKFDIIIIPEFGSKGMSKRSHRRINSKIVRSMMNWSHYKFRRMLMDKVSEYKSKCVIICSEEYTSKTCTRCGELKLNLGGNRTYVCDKCGLRIDRDINGARNILLKSISEVVLGGCPTLGPLSGD